MAHRTLPLAALFLIVACTVPPPDQATNAAPADSALRRDSAAATVDSSGCATTGRYVRINEVRVEREGRPPTSLRIIRAPTPDTPPQPEEFGPELVDAVWTGDLNGDGKVDRIVRFPGTYSSWGDAVIDVYAGCGGDRYVEVWGNDVYTVDLKPAKTGHRSAQGWLDLALVQRHGMAGDDYAFETLLRFEKLQYDVVPGSVYRIRALEDTRWYRSDRQ